MHLFLVANLVTTSKALVPTSVALVSNSFLLLVRHRRPHDAEAHHRRQQPRAGDLTRRWKGWGGVDLLRHLFLIASN